MPEPLQIDRDHTAVLIMDYQNGIVGDAAGTAELLDRATTVLDAARAARLPVMHVVVAFREGHPELNPRNRMLGGLKEAGRFREGAEETDIHPRVATRPGESVVTRRRVSAFATSDLDSLLGAAEITTLVLLGISTSGVVLSTVREAADADYELVVLADCCRDGDEEVHRVLTQKVFPRQAAVTNAEDFVAALAGP